MHPVLGVIASGRRYAAPASYLINQNFETPTTGFDNGEAGVWTNTGADPAYTGVVLLGAQSLRCWSVGNSASYVIGTFTGNADVWLFCKFRIVSLNTQDSDRQFAFFNGANDHAAMLVKSSGTVVIKSGVSSSSASATTLAPGVTYNVWLHYVSGGTSELYISESTTRPSVDGSGSVVLTVSSVTGTASQVLCYNAYYGGDFVFDHILVSASEIGNNP